MGILNVTPDSFSDGYPDLETAIAQARRLASEGADIIDVGGESTRPGSDPVSADTEMSRILPVIRWLSENLALPISVDTRRPEVAEAAVASGAVIINHVSASLNFREMIPVLKKYPVGYVAMHMRDQPKVMQKNIRYEDVLREITSSLMQVQQGLAAAEIELDRMLPDPGIGFGKTLDHNRTILTHLGSMSQKLKRPLLMGLSRKSWFGRLLGVSMDQRDALDAYSMLVSTLLPFPAVAVHRVHNVAYLKNGFRLSGMFGTDQSDGPWEMQ